MTKLYKFSEKRPKVGKYFICIINCFMYLGIKKLDDEDCDPVYYYKIFEKENRNKYYKEKQILDSINIGNPIIEYWFYCPDFGDIDYTVDCKNEFHSFGEEVEVAKSVKDNFWIKNAISAYERKYGVVENGND